MKNMGAELSFLILMLAINLQKIMNKKSSFILTNQILFILNVSTFITIDYTQSFL